MKTHSIEITTDQAIALYECVELASALAHRTGSIEHFARFAMHDILTNAVPEITGAKCSDAYKAAEKRIC